MNLYGLIVTIAATAILWFVFRKNKKKKNSGIPPIPTLIIDDNTESASTSASAAAEAEADLLGEYEVFLSFCGKDTRYGFTDFLYTYLHGAGIRTFRDNEGLHVGEEIGPELLKAITDSKISIPIFSKNYASSKWCLLELAQMVECQANGGQMIFPIFYDVDPYDVRHQSGSYEEAFCQHRKKPFNDNTIQGWKEALRKVGQLKGLELKKETGGCEGELVKKVVEKVLLNLKKNYKHVPDNLVGMEHHEVELMGLLDVGFNGVRIVGVHGMGGIGKTTITKVIYNKLVERFEFFCFLEDVREKSKHHNGVVDLQNQLVSTISEGNFSKIVDVDDGTKRIKDVVGGKKVLMVLDDVDEKFQFDKLVGNCDWFGSGSRIIVTTRNKEVLDSLEVIYQKSGLLDVYKGYEPELMNSNHSLQLFSKCAFMRDFPLEGYDTLSKQVVSTAAGLPLVLVTMGSLLFGKEDKDLWVETLRKLEKIPHDKVMGKLRISFEALEYEQKQIFLDIACLFIGHNKINPFYMWDDCEFYPRNGINVLVLRSLVKVGDDNRLWMHDHLRDLGRQIVREENPNDPGKWSRLWRREEALDICRTHQGIENVEALYLGRRWDRTTTRRPEVVVVEDFRKLPNLRYLSMDLVDLVGDSEHCLPNLRWLYWNTSFANSRARNLHLKNLVILELCSNITDEWEGWRQFKMSTKLKVLFLSCKNLRRVPYLSTFSTLERLDLNPCEWLCSLDGIEELQLLRYLKLSCCIFLERLSNLSKLSKLEELYVGFGLRLTEIQGLDKLESLKILNLTYCQFLNRIPNLSNLKKLKTLIAIDCYKLIEIQGLDKLDSLEILRISSCSLVRLPNLSSLKKLKTLVASNCSNLIEIQGLDGLGSLELLNISKCESLERIPNVSNLKRLRELKTQFCFKLIEIHGLEGLESLENLDMQGCRSIKRLSDLSNLKSLKTLNVLSCDELIEIQGLLRLKSLEHLEMDSCISIH